MRAMCAIPFWCAACFGADRAAPLRPRHSRRTTDLVEEAAQAEDDDKGEGRDREAPHGEHNAHDERRHVLREVVKAGAAITFSSKAHFPCVVDWGELVLSWSTLRGRSCCV